MFEFTQPGAAVRAKRHGQCARNPDAYTLLWLHKIGQTSSCRDGKCACGGEVILMPRKGVPDPSTPPGKHQVPLGTDDRLYTVKVPELLTHGPLPCPPARRGKPSKAAKSPHQSQLHCSPGGKTRPREGKGSSKVSQALSGTAGLRTQVIGPQVSELSLSRAGKGKERDIEPPDVSEYGDNAEFNVSK